MRGFIALQDAETGEIVELDTGHREVRALFETKSAERATRLSDELKKVGVDELPISTGEDYLKSLRRFFFMRERGYFRGYGFGSNGVEKLIVALMVACLKGC